ncbi:MAG: biotin transporter BioY [Cyanobacteriota bacterium]|nr:biotin transporter BioY [Cyanobacteriota bacterium]
MSVLVELLWAFIGLVLTICGTLVEASVALPPWNGAESGISTYSLGVTYQIGAVLLVGCLGGKNAGAISQTAYILLGLTPWFPIFSEGGGLNYIGQPAFGYILGFLPGAWVCGALAFRTRRCVESLGLSCLGGLLTIHITGLAYLVVLTSSKQDWLTMATTYSWNMLPGQFAIACAVTVLALVTRQLLFY